ncbi:MAG: hypothetical protein ACREMP_01885 [Candidatus Tyrphobacter sp.]
MPKRLLFALGVLLLSVIACKSSPSSTPTPGPTPTPTPNPTATTATVDATYNGAPYVGTIYANAAPGGCPGSTAITGSTVSAAATAVGGQNYSQATFSNLTADTDYVFFFVPQSGQAVSDQCGIQWSSGTIILTYP